MTGAIVRANLTRLLRDRTALFFTVVLPFLIILLVGLAQGGGGGGTLSIGVVAPDGPVAGDLLERLAADETVAVDRTGDAEALREGVRRGQLAGGIIVPADIEQLVAGSVDGDPARIEVVAPADGGLPAALDSTVTSVVNATNARVSALLAADPGADLSAGLSALDGASGLSVVRRDVTGDGLGLPSGFTASAGQNLILFVFITSLVGGVAVIESRTLGVTRRSLAAPTTVGGLLVGEATSRYLIAAAQGLIVVVGAALLFGVEWANLPATLLVLALFSLVGTGAAMLMGALFSTPQQADSLAAPLGIGLGMLGGCMWPLEIVPQPMRIVGHLTPHAWAVDAMNAVQGRGVGIGSIMTELVVLFGFAVVLLVTAGVALRRALVA